MNIRIKLECDSVEETRFSKFAIMSLISRSDLEEEVSLSVKRLEIVIPRSNNSFTPGKRYNLDITEEE